MNARKRWLRPLGVLLPLPLAGAIAGSVAFTATCDYDCGDMGGRGLFLLVLLATPPAAAGVLVLAGTRRTGAGGLVRLASKLLVAAVVVCTLVLGGAALAAGVAGVEQLISEPQPHRLGATEPSAFDRTQAREAGIWWLVVATVLAAMTIATALALRAAWHRRRAA